MVTSASLGYPRIGRSRELKKAQESFWKGEISEANLLQEAKTRREENWKFQKQAGLDVIPSNDFSLYDHVLDTIAMVGAVPERYDFKGGKVSLTTYFAMARGAQTGGLDVKAMEMTKWFDTNYHYLVPEFTKNQQFALSSSKAVDEFKEAKALGIITTPVLVGPVTFLQLGKMKDDGCNLDLLSRLLPVYTQVIAELAKAGAKTIQFHEPILVLDLSDKAKDAIKQAYETLGKAANDADVGIFLATYFGDMDDNIPLAVSLPIQTLHIDLTRGPNQLEKILATLPNSINLSLGVVDGRNIWRNNFETASVFIQQAVQKLGTNRVIVSSSCSLLHSPVSLAVEKKLDKELLSWLAFAEEKVTEIVTLARAVNPQTSGDVASKLNENREALASRKTSARIHKKDVKIRLAAITPEMLTRKHPYNIRHAEQQKSLNLPLLPSTTIGSFPQTAEVRKARADVKAGRIDEKTYTAFLQKELIACVRFQEEIGIDVLVHGEFERNDMVEYFGEQLEGFAFTEYGWVQSYGSRCVKPPIIFGDVARPTPMTIDWITFAAKQTKQHMKGMLTGPVTILQWSFVRDDQPRSETCKQIALAIRDEVQDLEEAGIQIIQIDEAALREGLPLRKSQWNDYLRWAVDSFRLTAAGVNDTTQIHTHMCYSEFNDIIKAVAEMDADVISIETSRSQMELLDAFVNFKYPNEIGPGVYDIHSPRVPNYDEMKQLLQKALNVIAPEQLWVNPDCGLKTRGWKEVDPALREMVKAGLDLRAELASRKKVAAS